MVLDGQFLPPATKLGQGNNFRSMCQEFCPEGGVSRPRPRGRGWGVWRRWGGGCLSPDTVGRLGVWPRGVSRPTLGWGWCPGLHPGGSRPTPGGVQAHTWGEVSRPRPVGMYPSMHWGRHPPADATAAGGMHPMECILVVLVFMTVESGSYFISNHPSIN